MAVMYMRSTTAGITVAPKGAEALSANLTGTGTKRNILPKWRVVTHSVKARSHELPTWSGTFKVVISSRRYYLQLHPLQAAKLVSVFLRTLEYCEGIMFLTTNRVSDFDEAILSRMHLLSKYQELDIKVRNQVWEHMLQRAHTSQGGAVIASEEMKRLAKTKLNGGQVRLLGSTYEGIFC